MNVTKRSIWHVVLRGLVLHLMLLGVVVVSPNTMSVATADPAPSAYASVVIGDNPLGYWRFEETSGDTTAVDEVGLSPGSIGGDATLGVDGAVDSGTAMSFSSANGGIYLGQDTSHQLKPNLMTLEAWVKTAASSSGVIGRFRSFGWNLSMNSSGQLSGGYHACGEAGCSKSSLLPSGAYFGWQAPLRRV